MEDTEHMSSIKASDLEKRIKILEEELLALRKRVNDMMSNYNSDSPEKSCPVTLPDSMNKDEWYSNHGHGD